MRVLFLFLILLCTGACAEKVGGSGDGFDDTDDVDDTDDTDDGDGGVDGDGGADTDDDTGTEDDQSCSSIEDCLDPPLDVCEGSETLIHYTGDAVCSDGQCTYEFDILDCGFECVPLEDTDAYCKETPCDEVVCDDPPDDFCAQGTEWEGTMGPDTLVTYAEEGLCDVSGSYTGTPGECFYSLDFSPCGEDACVQAPGDDYCE